MQNINEIASEIAQSINAQVQTPDKMIVDLSTLSDWLNTSLYDWYKSPDEEAYKSLPAIRGQFGRDTVYFACADIALFIELICPKIKDATQRDYYKGLFYKGYGQGLVDFENQYNMRCSNDMAPTLNEKKAILFSYYSELRDRYRNAIGFSSDAIEGRGYNSALMLSLAHKLQLMDKALAATKSLTPTENKKKRDCCQDKSLKDFLLGTDDSELIDKIGDVLKDAKGKKIATVIRALMNVGTISITSGECAKLCRALALQYNIKINERNVRCYLPNGSKAANITNNDIQTIRSVLGV